MESSKFPNVRFVGQKKTVNGTGKSKLEKNDFLKLMMEQLKHQDPLDPMKSNEYSAQLAQFSSLELLQNMNKSLKQSLNANYALAAAVNNTMSTNLIGKEVKLRGDEIQNYGQEKQSLVYKLAANAKYAKIEIRDENKNLIKVINLKDIQAGTYKVNWDFKDKNGEKVPHGSYKMKLLSKGLNSKEITTELYQIGTVDALRFTDKGSMIVIGKRQFALKDVYEIVNPPKGASNG